jgi:hypothetical protein
MLEKYFREKLSEEQDFTKIGSYWDSKGENEIDLLAINDFSKTATIAEVKKNKKKLDKSKLEAKAGVLQKQLEGYDVNFRLLSMEEM